MPDIGPITLGGVEQTKIIQDTVMEMLRAFPTEIKTIFPDGIMVGLLPQGNAEIRLQYYLSPQITHIEDLSMLGDPQYIQKMKAGLYPHFSSPFWDNLTQIPASFEDKRKDFYTLLMASKKKGTV